MCVLIDTNVLIDIFTKRPDYCEEERIILQKILDGELEAGISAISIPNIKYICRKDATDAECRRFLLGLFDYFTVVGLDSSKLISALHRKSFFDFEDCLQDECAIDINADYIVTRNKEDYEASHVRALTPAEFLKIW